MKVLLVNGGPHKEGCTYTALSEVAKELNKEGIETEIFWIGVKPISGCIACGKCFEKGKCVFNDVVNEFADKCKEADGFVFGSPVHYASATGSIRSFMDRLFYSTFTNPDLFLEYANNLPEDYDILMFGYSLFGKNGLVYLKGDDRWCKTKLATWGTFAYALSRSGMEKYLKRLEEEYCVADMPLADSRNAIKYLPNVKLIEHVGFNSSIR